VSDSSVRELIDWGYAKADALAREVKDSNRAVLYFENFFRSIQEADQPEAEEIVAEWALCEEDEARRFVALAVIDDLRIVSALPSLRVLQERFECADGPSAPYDWAKVNRIIGRLASA
jgi:hypothetical protein